MAENNITFELELATKSFEAAIGTANKAVEGFGRSVEQSGASATKELGSVGKAAQVAGKALADGAKAGTQAWETFKGVLGAEAVVGAFNVMKSAASALFQTFVVDGVKGALDAEASIIKLRGALMNSGDAANGTIEDFQAFAAQMEKNTSADGDAVLSQLALAKNYGLTNYQAKEVVKTATNMAAALGTDVDTEVRKLSESFNGSVGKLAKLNPAIADLGKEGAIAGGALSILSAQFDGAAENKLASFQGRLDQSKVAFGNLQEEIGGLITQNPSLIAALQQASDIFKVVTQYISDNKQQLMGLVTDGFVALISSIQTVISVGADFLGFFDRAAEGFVSLGAVIATNVLPTLISMLDGLSAVAFAFDEELAAKIDSSKVQLEEALVANEEALAGAQATAAEREQANTAAGLAAADAANLKKIAAQNATNAALEASQKASNAAMAAQQEADNSTALSLSQTQETALKALHDDAAAKQKKKDDEDEAARVKKEDADFKQRFKNAQAKNKAFLDEQNKQFLAEQKAQNEAADKQYNREQTLTGALRAEGESRKQFEDRNNAEKVSGARDTLTQIAGLMDSSNGALFEAGKAAAIAQATMSSYLAVMNALAQVPYPANIVAAAAVGVVGALQVSKIAATQRPAKTAGNFATGGIVPGASMTGDRLTAGVNSREGIFTLKQQKNLFDIANGKTEAGGGNGNSISEKIDNLVSAVLGQPIVVEIDGERVATAVRNQVRGGFALGV